jgi:hypothetical protein
MFQVAIPADDTAYNAAVRADPTIAEKANEYGLGMMPWLREQPGFQSLVIGEDHVTEQSLATYTFATAEQAAAFVAAFDARIKPYYAACGVRFGPAQVYGIVFQI